MMQKKNQTGAAYEPWEEIMAEKIGACDAKAYEQARQIGEVIDGWIKKRGGTKYGDATIERAAAHPSVTCTPQHLRRYWGFYLVFSQLGTELDGLKISTIYQLSRFYTHGLPEKEAKKWVLAYANEVRQKGMTATQAGAAVSRELEQSGNMRKPRATKSAKPSGDDSKPTAAPTPQAVDNIGNACSGVAEVLDWVAQPDRFASANTNELRRDCLILLRPVVDIVEKLSLNGPDEDFATLLRAFGHRLRVCADRLAETAIDIEAQTAVTAVAPSKRQRRLRTSNPEMASPPPAKLPSTQEVAA